MMPDQSLNLAPNAGSWFTNGKTNLRNWPGAEVAQSVQSLQMGIERISTRIKELEAFDPGSCS
jgi:hypothetical protein